MYVNEMFVVPMAIGDMMISFGATMEIPAEVVFIHPIHNIAIVKYNPDFLQEKSFKSAVISKEPLHQGDSVYLVGLTRKHQPVWQATTVSKIEELFINEVRNFCCFLCISLCFLKKFILLMM